MHLDVRLPGTSEAPVTAREAVSALADDLTPTALDDVRLLVSELVTNSIRHAGSGIGVDLTVRTNEGTVRVEVKDAGEGFRPSVPEPLPMRESGWGLYILDRVADRWGVDSDGSSLVWFEIDDGPEQGDPA
jgi:anti-sigma regulatory factor (Ser/Thr protein kinase)